MEDQVRVTGERLVCADGVRQDERVFTVLVLKEVVDAFLFHQAADEIEVRLAVLDAIFFLLVAAGEFDFVIAESVSLEHFLDDVRHTFLLENPAVRSAREEPQPGHDRGPVLGVTAHVGGLHQATDKAIEKALVFLADVEPDRGLVADRLVKVDRAILAAEFDLDVKQPAQFLLHRDGANGEHIGTEGGLDGDLSGFLFQRHAADSMEKV